MDIFVLFSYYVFIIYVYISDSQLTLMLILHVYSRSGVFVVGKISSYLLKLDK